MLYLESFLNTGIIHCWLCEDGGVHFKLVAMFCSQISVLILRQYEAGMVGVVTASSPTNLEDAAGHLFIMVSAVSDLNGV